MSTTEELAHLISEAEFNTLPKQAVEAGNVVILDGLAVTLADSAEPPPRIVADYTREMGGTADCSVFGQGGRPRFASVRGGSSPMRPWGCLSGQWSN